MAIEARKQLEAEFHDKLREHSHTQRWSPEAETDDPLWANLKYYAIERNSREYVESWLQAHAPGRRLLDYCCGNGDDSLLIAGWGGEVVGIDISEVSVQNCRAKAQAAGLADRATFQVMDAENLEFPDASFDAGVVYGVLHHLDLDKAMSELARVLRPGGQIICTEALRHNPAIHLYRRMTPDMRTVWEVDHILGRPDFQKMRRYFDVDIRFFHLASLAAVPLRKTRVFGPVLTALQAVDAVLLRVPGVRWLAWQAVFVLTKKAAH